MGTFFTPLLWPGKLSKEINEIEKGATAKAALKTTKEKLTSGHG